MWPVLRSSKFFSQQSHCDNLLLVTTSPGLPYFLQWFATSWSYLCFLDILFTIFLFFSHTRHAFRMPRTRTSVQSQSRWTSRFTHAPFFTFRTNLISHNPFDKLIVIKRERETSRTLMMYNTRERNPRSKRGHIYMYIQRSTTRHLCDLNRVDLSRAEKVAWVIWPKWERGSYRVRDEQRPGTDVWLDSVCADRLNREIRPFFSRLSVSVPSNRVRSDRSFSDEQRH